MNSPDETTSTVQVTSPESVDSVSGWAKLSDPGDGQVGSSLASPHQDDNSAASESTMGGAKFQETAKPANSNVVDMGHSDINLQTYDTIFKTHRHLLVNFNRLEEQIKMNSGGAGWSIQLDRGEQSPSPEDVANTFKILYASVIAGPFEFEPPVLISALRMATAYDYSALRAYSIDRLEKAKLVPVQRIILAREFSLTSWEEPAFEELYERDEALTDGEAQILGVIVVAKVARMREAAKLKRGKEIGEREYRMSLERAEQERREKELAVEKEAAEKERNRREAAERKAKEQKAKEELARKEKEKREQDHREAMVREKERREREERARKEAEEKSMRESESREVARQFRKPGGSMRKPGLGGAFAPYAMLLQPQRQEGSDRE